jgi:exodeoxyribonuclease VII small subunit
MAETPSNTQTDFESSIKELEKLVSELERGEQPLEDQLKSFEKGVALSRDCMKRLEEIERRVELLIQSSDGKLSTTEFDPTIEGEGLT